MRQIFRILLPIGILAIAIGGFLMLQTNEPEATPEVPKAREWLVHAQTVDKRPLVPTVNLFGRVVTPSNSILSSILDAEVVAVKILPGQSVTQGDILVQLDSRTIETQVRQFAADVARIKASIEREAQRLKSDHEILQHEERLQSLSSESLKRYQTLKSRNVISQAEYDAAERTEQQAQLAVTARRAAIREYDSRVAVLAAELQRAEASLAKVRLDLAETVIVAPYDGRITAVHVAVGSRVRNGSALVEMYDQTQIEIRTLIPNRHTEQVRNTIRNNGILTAVTKLDGQQLTLQLDRLGSTVDPGRGGIDAYFHLVANTDYPELGRSVSLELSLTPIADAIALPYQAVYGSNHVFKIEDNLLQQVEIERFGKIQLEQDVFLVATSEQLRNGDLILTTQLANASIGLAVKVWDAQ